MNIQRQTLAPHTYLMQEKVIELLGSPEGDIDFKAAVKLARIHGFA